MITSEGDAVVSFKVRGNVDLFFGVPQKNNPQSMSTGLGLLMCQTIHIKLMYGNNLQVEHSRVMQFLMKTELINKQKFKTQNGKVV